MYFYRNATAIYTRDSLPNELAVTVGNILGNIGILFFDKANYDSAIYYLEDAAQLFTQYELTHSALNSKLNLGGILASAGRYETAAEYFKEVYHETEEGGMKYYALTNWFSYSTRQTGKR